MREEHKYFCEKCNHEFFDKENCLEHEKTCGVKQKFTCDKCGKIIEYTTESEYDPGFDFSYNECWTFSPNHYRARYGSGFDGCEFKINICDDCLLEFVRTFKHQEDIWNSGSNYYYDMDDEDIKE